MSRSIEKKISRYSQLSPAERRNVERYVEAHPDMAPLLEEAQAFDDLLRQARMLPADPPGDEALAYYAVTRRLGGPPAPAWLQDVFDQIEARLAADPALQARYERLERRIAAMEADDDAVAQFERLTGHRLEQGPQPATEHAPAPRRRYGYFFAWAVVAVVALLAVLGGLRIASDLATPPEHRLAAFAPSDLDAEALRLRSGGPPPATPSSDGLYRQAVPLLRTARTATLGLFPRYDQARLDQAAGLLQGVVAQEAQGSLLQLEAYYLLGKIRLLQRDLPGARAALQEVVNGSDWRADDTANLLEQLEALPRP